MAALKNDMLDTIQLIRDFWPEFQFTNEDFLQGKPEFVVQFYSNFISDLNNNITVLLNEEIPPDEFDDIQDSDGRIILYCKVAKILRKMNYYWRSFNLSDFYYNYTSRKIYHFLKYSIHFMVYMNNCLDRVTVVVQDNMKKLANGEKFKVLKEQCLQDTADNAENLARCLDSHQYLLAKLEEAKKKHKKMQEDKVIEEKKLKEKNAELKIIQNEVGNLQYELKLLEDEERTFKESIITDAEFKSLQDTEKYLAMEEQQLYQDKSDTSEDIVQKKEEAQRLEDFATSLANIHFDDLDIEALHRSRHEEKVLINAHKKVNNELNIQNSLIEMKKKDIREVEKTKQKTESLRDEVEKKCTVDMKNLEIFYQSNVIQCAVNFEECQRLESEISRHEEEMSKIKQDEEKLNVTVAKEYKKILTMDHKTTEKFHHMLKTIKDHKY